MKARLALLYSLTAAGIFFALNSAPAQGTAFTYQGLLNDSGSPANGSYDLQFTLYNDASNQPSVGAPIIEPATSVSNGLFTVTLDFGAGVFIGRPLWLEISVRTNNGQAGFFTLSPRQPLTPAPYAVTAANLTGTLPTSQLSGTLPASQLSGMLPTSQLIGTIPVANILGAQPANINLATNLNYTNCSGVGQALLPVIPGHTYIYCPTTVGGVYDGSYVLGITGSNWTDVNWVSIDPGNEGYFPPAQTNQLFVATQNTVTFINGNATNGPVNDTLYDLANQVINGTLNSVGQFTGQVNGTGQFSGNLSGVFSGVITNSVFSGAISNTTFSGVITNSALAGNAQGGAITNLDSSIHNLNDSGGNLLSIINGLPPAGGTIYAPNAMFTVPSIPLANYNAGFPPYAPGLTIYGNGSAMSMLSLSSASPANLLDQSTGVFGQVGPNLKGLTLDGSQSPGSMGYVSAPGASGTPIFHDVEFDNWLAGAVSSSPDADYNDIQANNCSVGITLAPYSDVSRLTFTRGFGVTNADVETDSRGNYIFADVSTANIGVLVGAGGANFMQITAETVTNAAIGVGFPANWPFQTINNRPFTTQYAGTQYGNDTAIGPLTAGWGYSLPPSVNWANPFAYNNGAFMKIWNSAAFGGATIADESLLGESAVISYTLVGDSAPYFFDHVTVGPTNLFTFSNGHFIPSQDGWQVGVNLPERQFNQDALVYQRDTSGNVLAAGNITALGEVVAGAAQVGSLTVAAASANSLLATDDANSVTSVAIGSGLTLSGGTLSASALGGLGPPAGSINLYTLNHTATASDGTILLSGFGLTLTLPDAFASGAGRSYTVKLISNSSAPVVTTGSQYIDGRTSYNLSQQYKYVMVQSDGANWWVVGNN